MNSQRNKSPLALLEAVWGGVFGTVVCCLIALIPVLMVEQNVPVRLPGNQAVLLILAVVSFSKYAAYSRRYMSMTMSGMVSVG